MVTFCPIPPPLSLSLSLSLSLHQRILLFAQYLVCQHVAEFFNGVLATLPCLCVPSRLFQHSVLCPSLQPPQQATFIPPFTWSQIVVRNIHYSLQCHHVFTQFYYNPQYSFSSFPSSTVNIPVCPSAVQEHTSISYFYFL